MTIDCEKGHGRRRGGGDAGRACTRLLEASVELDGEILIEEIRTEYQDTSWTAGGKVSGNVSRIANSGADLVPGQVVRLLKSLDAVT